VFEIDVAKQYLFPRWRRLSLSIISLIALLVISLVVWLILTFFSVTTSLEKGWMEKLVTLSAPVRISPTEDYFRSDYYLADTLSHKADYTTRTLKERVAKPLSMYDPVIDEAIPGDWIKTDQDLLKTVYSTIEGLKKEIPDLQTSFYEVASVGIKLNMKRLVEGSWVESALSHTLFALNFDPQNPSVSKIMLQPPVSKGELFTLPSKGVLLPRQYYEAGVLMGDPGAISYEQKTLTSKQEVKHPIHVAGFYDPGLLGMGGKFLLVNSNLLSMIRSNTHQDGIPGTEGISLKFSNLDLADQVKAKLTKAFEEKGITPFFQVETFKDFDFVKPFLRELTSQKNLFTLLSGLILVVACSNIISLLIILVHDKKKEIAILRALGASSFSIAFIFAFSGLVIGIVGSLLGVAATALTLHFVPDILDFLSWLQGFSAFHNFFGSGALDISMSTDTLIWVFVMTTTLSLLSGLIPAIKACKLKPSEALKSE